MDNQTTLLDTQNTCSFIISKNAIIKANYLHATANSEKENLLKIGYNKNIEIIANGIEIEKLL